MTIFWGVAPCSLVDVTDISELLTDSIMALMMEAVSTSETSVNFYQTTRSNITEDTHLHTRRQENLKSHLISAPISPQFDKPEQRPNNLQQRKYEA
jgi:hypothetical protein